MKITLQVNGQEMTFSEQELSSILEEHFSSKITQTAKVAQKPTEDAWFEVKPQAIDQKLFEEKREDSRQEETRKIILEAFAEMKDKPEYGKDFETMMPKKTWSVKTVYQLNDMACNLGDHNANWVEQALEWAQRIANGESWEAICNDDDTANWYRLVVWKNRYAQLVGGSVNRNNAVPASDVCDNNCYETDIINCAVPLIVRYKK